MSDTEQSFQNKAHAELPDFPPPHKPTHPGQKPWPYNQPWPVQCEECDALRMHKPHYSEVMFFNQHFVYHIPESDKKDDDYKRPDPEEIRSLKSMIFGYTNKEELVPRLRMFVACLRDNTPKLPKAYYTDIIERIFSEAGYVQPAHPVDITLPNGDVLSKGTHQSEAKPVDGELRKSFIRSLSIAQVHNPDAQGEAIIEREAAVLEKLFATHLQAAEKAYGGCHDCYGKGYATVNDRWLANDTDQDIGSPGGYITGGNPMAMKFCKCERGKQLEKLISEQRPLEVNIDGKLVKAAKLYTEEELQATVREAQSGVVSVIYSIANDLAREDPTALGAVSLEPYFANAIAIYSEYLKGDNYERIDWKSLDLPTLNQLQQLKQGEA